MRALLTSLVLFALPAGAAELEVSSRRAPEAAAWSVSASYFGETILHPGVAVGVERKLKFWGRRRGLETHGFFAGADLGTYWHARNDVGLFVSTDLGYRLVFPRGFRLEALLGLGYLHTFDDGAVYEASGGRVTTVANTGHPALMTSALLGLGWDFARFSIFLRVGAFGQYPYNTEALPHLEAQLGFSIPLGRGGAR